MELLAQTELTPGQLGNLSVASTSGEALLGSINEVLDFAKIGAGQLLASPIAHSRKEWLTSVSYFALPG